MFEETPNSNDVLKYLTHLKEVKKDLGRYYFHQEDDVFVIFTQNGIPKLTLTEKLFKMFQEIEV
jgi:hypothetical protein